jgi:hypothetical protein
LLGAAAAALALLAAPAARAALGPPVTIDGPSSAIVSLDGVALAQDGSGALVYRKLVGSSAHVFAALEQAGVWAAPAQLDAPSAASASAAAVAVADGGRVAVAWIAGGTLYAAVHAAGASSFTAPQAIAPATGVPALGMGISGTAYVAFASPDGAGSDIDGARLDRTSTSFVALSAPLSAAPVTLASGGAGPVITVAADATAVIAWAATQSDGSTHVFVRRASAAGPSPVLDDATVASLDGLSGGSADSPVLGVEYDASDAWIAFRESFGGSSRLVVDELLGDELSPPALADSLGTAPGTSSAFAPSLAVNGNGGGLLAGELAPGNQVVVSELESALSPPAWSAGAALAPAPAALAPAPLAVLSASGIGGVVYTPSVGALALAPFAAGKASGAPFALSSASLGTVLPSDGLDAAADDRGDIAVGYVTGSASGLTLAVQPLVVAPGAPRAVGTQLWTSNPRPTLRWQPAAESWAPATYTVYIDGARVATTTATSYQPPANLADARHSWRVVAADALGQSASSQTRRLLIDAAPPVVRLAVTGRRRAGVSLRFTVSVSALSGLRRVSIAYGDGASAAAAASTHAYAKAGSYTVTVTATDLANVRTVLHEQVHVS